MSPLRLTSPRVLPSTGVTPLHQYYDPSDFLTTIPAFSLCRLVRRYCPPWQSDEDLPRSPCYFDDMPCSQTPGMPDITAHSVMSDGVFWVCQVMDHPKYSLNGALSLQPEGLRPTTSLSTLHPHGYPYQPKTRYQVRWVPASWAALSAASNTAPRGARQVNLISLQKWKSQAEIPDRYSPKWGLMTHFRSVLPHLCSASP